MNSRYLLLSIILLGLGVILIFLPEKKHKLEKSPEQLMLAVNDHSRYLSGDQVAHMLIEKDPSLLLIDVRDTSAYKSYSLPGAMNIPLDSLLSEQWQLYLDQPFLKKVFYSNGSVYSGQAWALATRLGYTNCYILEDGLNGWVETILRPSMPQSTASSEEIDLYQSRLAASQFFGGGKAAVTSTVSKPVNVKRKRAKSVPKGGC